MSNSTKKSWSITPGVALGLIFITLKLTGYISWSWWWVTAPFWVIPAVLLVALAFMAMIVGVITLHERNKGRDKK